MTREASADRFYSRWAWLYDLLARRSPGIARLRSSAIDALDVSRGDIVVDMGCGPGPNFPFLREAVGSSGAILGIDVARGALARADARRDRADWPNVHVVRADATRPPIEAADAVLATFVVGMFEDPRRAIRDWCTLVGPGGRICLVHFARSDRWYAPASNAALAGLVFLSTPGKRRIRGDATVTLDRRVTQARQALARRCSTCESWTQWGGLVHLAIGTVAPSDR